jgi:hypothetical protein
MRQIVYTQVGAGNSPPIPLDVYGRPEISIQVDITGAGPWGIEQTLDNPFTTPAANILWVPHPDANMIGQTVDRQGNYAFLPAALRLVQTGAGTVKLTVLQAGGGGLG